MTFNHYNLETYRRSNQDTCLVHKPALYSGEWVESGDLIADSSASKNGELALGQNIFVAYMPWEGYNYEDAILINERLVYDDAYTSIHIERYEIETQESPYSNLEGSAIGQEHITRTIPDLKPEQTAHLDSFGIARIGSWVEEGDILVGKVTPINPKKQTGYQKLILKLFEKKASNLRDSSLRAPKGIKANVIDVQILAYTLNNRNKSLKGTLNQKSNKKSNTLIAKKKTKNDLKNPMNALSQEMIHIESFQSKSNPTSLAAKFEHHQKFLNDSFKQYMPNNKKVKKTGPTTTSKWLLNASQYKKSNQVSSQSFEEQTLSTICTANKKSPFRIRNKEFFYNTAYSVSVGRTEKTVAKVTPSKVNNKFKSNAPVISTLTTYVPKKPKLQKTTLIPTIVHIYLAEKRKIQVGDKMAGRHGNKGIISNILPRQDMPYLPDGTPIDIVLNPLGVPSRMNVGQIYECLLGLAGRYLGEHYKISSFDEMYGAEASRSFVFSKLFEARKKTGIEWLFDPNSPGKMRIFDGRTAECYDQPVTVGMAYMLKLVHMVDDKMHSRSTGPYSLVTQQPLRGRAKQGGQRLGEMEVWAIEGYGAAFVLLEMLTLKSDDMTGRLKLWSDLILNKNITLGTPESFKVLVCELQALCLDIGLFRSAKAIPNPSLAASTEEVGSKSKQPSQKRMSLQLKEISNLMFLP